MITLKRLNAAVAPLGVQVIRGKGYFYYVGLTSDYQIGESTYVNSLNQLNLEQWLQDARSTVFRHIQEYEEFGDLKNIKRDLPDFSFGRKAVIHHLAFKKERSGASKTFFITDELVSDENVPELLFAKDNAPFFVAGCFFFDKTGEPYSLSVGDVVEVNDRFFLCAPLGWKEISREEREAL